MNAINSTLSLRRARYFCTGKSWKLLHWQKYTLHKIFVVIFSASLEFTFDTTPLHRYHILVFYPRHLQGCKIFRLHSRYKILSLLPYRYGWETGYDFFPARLLPGKNHSNIGHCFFCLSAWGTDNNYIFSYFKFLKVYLNVMDYSNMLYMKKPKGKKTNSSLKCFVSYLMLF